MSLKVSYSEKAKFVNDKLNAINIPNPLWPTAGQRLAGTEVPEE